MENNSSAEIKPQEIAKPKRHTFPKGNCANPNGRPRKPEIEMLREALQKAKENHGVDFIEHFVDLAYKDKNVAIALAKKLIPDKIEGEGFGIISITNILSGEQIEAGERRMLVEALRERRSQGKTS